MIFYNNTASMMDIFLTELMFATNTSGPMRNARRRARGMRTDREMMRKWLVRRPYCGMKTSRTLKGGSRSSPVAQSVEQAAVNRWVAGSSPARGAIHLLTHCF